MNPFDPKNRFRLVTVDGELRLLCNSGGKVAGEASHLFQHGEDKLGYSGNSSRVRQALLDIPGVRPWQTGDTEFSVVFPTALFPQVAEIVKPRSKRPPSDPSALLRKTALARKEGGVLR